MTREELTKAAERAALSFERAERELLEASGKGGATVELAAAKERRALRRLREAERLLRSLK